MSLEQDDGLGAFLEREAERCAASQAAYDAMVARRRACRACAGLQNPSFVADGAYDSTEIGPWSTWQSNLDAPIVVVGQDFGDVAYFEKHCGADSASNRTNANLVQLLGSIGINVGLPGSRDGRGDLFFTNAVLCLKGGGMQAKVRSEWFRECGKRFLRAQIELVRPKVVVGLGERAHNAVLVAFGLPSEPLKQAILSAGTRLPTGALAIGVFIAVRACQISHATLMSNEMTGNG